MVFWVDLIEFDRDSVKIGCAVALNQRPPRLPPSVGRVDTGNGKLRIGGGLGPVVASILGVERADQPIPASQMSSSHDPRRDRSVRILDDLSQQLAGPVRRFTQPPICRPARTAQIQPQPRDP